MNGRKFKHCHKNAPLVRAGEISSARTVPEHIDRPPYLNNSNGEPKREAPQLATPELLNRMRKAGKIASEVLANVGAAVTPGATTDQLDEIAHNDCVSRGVYPSPLGYRGYPKSICTSVNEVICHGIPDSRALEDGDIVNIDVTVYVDGVHGDTNATFLVGDVDAGSRKLITVTRECLELGIAEVKPGVPVYNIGKAIENHATANGFGVIHMFVGHGIGEQFHTEPSIPHYFDRRYDQVLQPGMTFTIEPMISIGNWREELWNDGWTAVTADKSRVAQFEHTMVVTDDGVEVLTA